MGAFASLFTKQMLTHLMIQIGIALGGQMAGDLLVVAWPNGNDIVASTRFATCVLSLITLLALSLTLAIVISNRRSLGNRTFSSRTVLCAPSSKCGTLPILASIVIVD